MGTRQVLFSRLCSGHVSYGSPMPTYCKCLVLRAKAPGALPGQRGLEGLWGTQEPARPALPVSIQEPGICSECVWNESLGFGFLGRSPGGPLALWPEGQPGVLCPLASTACPPPASCCPGEAGLRRLWEHLEAWSRSLEGACSELSIRGPGSAHLWPVYYHSPHFSLWAPFARLLALSHLLLLSMAVFQPVFVPFSVPAVSTPVCAHMHPCIPVLHAYTYTRILF